MLSSLTYRMPMSRLPPLDPATLTPEQQRVAAEIAGARKNVRGPFTIWLRNPRLAEHANAFGIALRDSKVLPRRLFELAVIVVCRNRRRAQERARPIHHLAAQSA